MKFSAVILAGGRSTRMGQDKAWLEMEGQPLLARQVALAKAVGADEVFISGRPQAGYSSFGCPVLLDAWPDCGPLGGIERALATAGHNLVLVLAVDLPCLELSLLKALLAECTEEIGVAPICAERIEPLVAIYPKAGHRIAVSLLQSGQYAARAFAEKCRRSNLIKELRFRGVPRDFTNWNCPEDVAGNGTAHLR